LTLENIYASNKEGDDVVNGFIPPKFEKSPEEISLLKEIFLENFLTNQLTEEEIMTLIFAL